MYEKVSSNFYFSDREKAVLDFWKQNRIFEKSVEQRKGRPTYAFYDGPPTANGKPHIGHVLTRVIKDMIPRYRAMKGYMAPRKAGWDAHGLPVELEVERELGINGKDQIEDYGVGPFVGKCKESVWKYKSMWEDFSGKVGFWADMDSPYVTYDNKYIESVWWSLKEIWKKGLLYKGFKVVPYCPRCGTPLSSHEVAQGYKSVKERSAIVRFKAKGEDAYFLAWTTTPWTLASNCALCVNPNEIYRKVKAADGRVYYVADALLDSALGKLGDAENGVKPYDALETYRGSELEGREYEPLFECTRIAAEKQNKKAHFITLDNYVTMTEGTGIVHTAPAFGEDDARIGKKYDLPFIQFVDGKGNMTEETPYAGKFVKDADPLVLADLDKAGKLFSAPKFEHDYPFCWRCDSPLIYYARESWFIEMTRVRDDLIRNNDSVNWIPKSIGSGRFGDWLKNIQDWGVSRNRYWGTPLNIWECPCGNRECVGSIAELKSMSPNCPDDIELHRPFIDEVVLNCPKCGGIMRRVPEVVDCWYDSGAMPFAQHHYPFENEEAFKEQFPAEFISEAVDQTRGWFYSLLAISTLLFNKAPYKNVIVLGLIQDENGRKMSKSKGNAVDPFDALATYGADAIRWYFYTNSAPWLPNRFHGKAVAEGRNKFMGTLWNAYAFYVLYANIDEFNPVGYKTDYSSLSIMDKWLLSKLNALIEEVDGDLDSYAIPEAGRALQDFVDGLSNWYVRRSRGRFWTPGLERDKINAYTTLYAALATVIKLAAPMIPFMTEDVYRNLVLSADPSAPESVHLCDYPVSDPSLIDKKLEASMDEALKIVVLGRAARNAVNIKNRRPLSKVFVVAPEILSEELCEIIADELNVKEVEFVTDSSSYVSYLLKPLLKTLGPKYGKRVGAIKEALAKLDGAAAKRELDKKNALTIEADGEKIELTSEELLIETVQKEGFHAESDGKITVILDANPTPELIEEGLVREIISKIQTTRKNAGFEVLDRIKIYVSGNDKILATLEANRDAVFRDVLAVDVVPSEGGSYVREWDVNGEKVVLGVEKIQQ